MILTHQSIICIRSKNISVLIIENFWHLLCRPSLCSYISLSTWVPCLCETKVICHIWFNFLSSISDLYCTLVNRINIWSLSSVWWLRCLWLVFKSIIDEWFHYCIILIEFSNSFLLGNRVFKSTNRIKLAYCIFI